MKYLCYYDTSDKEGRSYCLAATNKIEYIAKKIAEFGERVELISASMSSTKGSFKARREVLSKGVELRLFKAYRRKSLIEKLFADTVNRLKLFSYLLFKIKRKEKIIVYHSLGYMGTVKLAKRLKGFELILEAEEIYGDVICSPKVSRKELSFFKLADAYIFPTEMLDKKVNKDKKPSVVIYGTYDAREQIAEGFSDGKIHCVYAGTFDPRKGGALSVVSSAEYLPENYHLHVIGFGSDKDTEELLEKIERTSKRSKCRLTYDGLLSGDDYIKFIQSCHIGLSTQNPDARFNDTSFPSKILSYLANGLHVVSTRIPVVEGSAVGDFVCYYDENAPKAIAEAIINVDVDSAYDSRATIKELDRKFSQNLKHIIGE